VAPPGEYELLFQMTQRHGVGRRVTDGQNKSRLRRAGCQDRQQVLLRQCNGTRSAARHPRQMRPIQVDAAARRRSITHGEEHAALPAAREHPVY